MIIFKNEGFRVVLLLKLCQFFPDPVETEITHFPTMHCVRRTECAQEWTATACHICDVVGFILNLRVGFDGWRFLVVLYLNELVIQRRNFIKLIDEVMGKERPVCGLLSGNPSRARCEISLDVGRFH